jgi:hypothetical protein
MAPLVPVRFVAVMQGKSIIGLVLNEHDTMNMYEGVKV